MLSNRQFPQMETDLQTVRDSVRGCFDIKGPSTPLKDKHSQTSSKVVLNPNLFLIEYHGPRVHRPNAIPECLHKLVSTHTKRLNSGWHLRASLNALHIDTRAFLLRGVFTQGVGIHVLLCKLTRLLQCTYTWVKGLQSNPLVNTERSFSSGVK